MYQVRIESRGGDSSHFWRHTRSAKEAYELAHQLQGALWGLSSDESLNALWEGLNFSVIITDEEGNDAWQECSRARCPTVGVQ